MMSKLLYVLKRIVSGILALGVFLVLWTYIIYPNSEIIDITIGLILLCGVFAGLVWIIGGVFIKK